MDNGYIKTLAPYFNRYNHVAKRIMSKMGYDFENSTGLKVGSGIHVPLEPAFTEEQKKTLKCNGRIIFFQEAKVINLHLKTSLKGIMTTTLPIPQVGILTSVCRIKSNKVLVKIKLNL